MIYNKLYSCRSTTAAHANSNLIPNRFRDLSYVNNSHCPKKKLTIVILTVDELLLWYFQDKINLNLSKSKCRRFVVITSIAKECPQDRIFRLNNLMLYFPRHLKEDI